MSFNPNNWANGLVKPYDGPLRESPKDTVYFQVFDKVKPYRVGIRAEKVPTKTAEWDAKRIGLQKIRSLVF